MPEVRDRPAQNRVEWRGRLLPEGMTAECFEELTSLFADFESDRFEGQASDAAIRAFEVSHNLQR